MPWNDFALDGSLDWSHVDFLNMFVDALNERLPAVNYDQSHTGGPEEAVASEIDAVEVGDNVQGPIFIGSFQAAARLNAPHFLAVDFDPSGSTYPDPPGEFDDPDSGYYTEESWREAAGIDPDGFRRRRPREVQSDDPPEQDLDGNWYFTVASGEDTQGNANADGQLAWGISSDPRRVFRYDAGIWTTEGVVPHDAPDLLDSDNAPAGGSYVAPGDIEGGDYIGWWLFEELRDGINLLVKMRVVPVFPGAFYREAEGEGADRAATVADLAANWAGASDTTPADMLIGDLDQPPLVLYSLHAGSTDADAREWELHFGAGQDYDLPIGCAKGIECWVAAHGLATYDPNDYPASGNNAWQLVETIALADAVTSGSSTAVWGNTATVPTAPASPGFSGAEVYLYTICQFDVAGGYQYTEAT